MAERTPVRAPVCDTVGVSRDDAQGYVVSVGAVIFSAILLLLPYDWVRLRVATQTSDATGTLGVTEQPLELPAANDHAFEMTTETI